MKKIRLIELFAGYGSQAMAIKRLGIPFEPYRVVEFDKYAIKSYNAVHGTNYPTIDIRDFTGADLGVVDTDKYNYVMTYSFPCTDLSLAGKMQGMSRGSGTRSGLLWEVERILREVKDNPDLNLPQFLLMENVPQVHGEQNIKDFGEWISFLDTLGYVSKWSDLNARDYGIPQNRVRCFMVSYLDKSLKFKFPTPIKLDKTARDFLEESVEDKYYLNSERAQELIEKLINDTEDPDKIEVKANTESGIIELDNGGLVDLTYPESDTRRGRVQTRPRVCPTLTSSGEISKVDKEIKAVDLSTYKPEINTVVNCIKAGARGITNFQKDENGVLEIYGLKTILKYRIRKLTPLECYRLMGVSDDDAYKMLSVNTDRQCYKQAGNSIVVSVLEAIFRNLLLGGSDNTSGQIDIYDLL